MPSLKDLQALSSLVPAGLGEPQQGPAKEAEGSLRQT